MKKQEYFHTFTTVCCCLHLKHHEIDSKQLKYLIFLSSSSSSSRFVRVFVPLSERIQWRFCADSENMISHSSSNYSRTESLSFMLEYFTENRLTMERTKLKCVLTTRVRKKFKNLKWFLWTFSSMFFAYNFHIFFWSRK
jgi:hypothetical protein